jgi:4-hydroxybutyryl-CoA dehydratase/vinylacetyl-CoA-Delta-isomerase
MNGEQYRDSLRKMKHVVYIFGERISNPVDHPIVIPSQNAVAMAYDLAFDPRYEDLMTVTSSLTGRKINRFTQDRKSVCRERVL